MYFFLQANQEAGPANHVACLANKNWVFFLQANPEAGPASHVACTVEMSNLAQQYEVAVIDEIQVLEESPNIIAIWLCVWTSWLELKEGGRAVVGKRCVRVELVSSVYNAVFLFLNQP